SKAPKKQTVGLVPGRATKKKSRHPCGRRPFIRIADSVLLFRDAGRPISTLRLRGLDLQTLLGGRGQEAPHAMLVAVEVRCGASRNLPPRTATPTLGRTGADDVGSLSQS